MFLLVRVFICVFAVGFSLYLFIAKQNSLTEVQREIPTLAKKVKILKEENQRLEYQIERFESPIRLMELSRQPQYSDLHYPSLDSVIVIGKETKTGWDP